MVTKYHHKPLEETVKDICTERCFGHWHPWDKNIPEGRWDPEAPRVCQSCCLTATHGNSVITAYLLRSYHHYYSDNTPSWIVQYNEGADPLEIWQVTRATSAAPFYFEMLQAVVDGEPKSFKDGGLRENNPSGAAWNEFHSLYEGRKEQPALLLSVGTGRADQSRDGFAEAWPDPWGRLPIVKSILKALENFSVIQEMLIKLTESEKQHQFTRGYARGEHTWYKRLNVSTGLEKMPLDHWVKGPWRANDTAEERVIPGGASLTMMQDATEAYLNIPFDAKFEDYARPGTMLEQTAEKLVRQRRARARQGGPRWETFIKDPSTRKTEGNGHAAG